MLRLVASTALYGLANANGLRIEGAHTWLLAPFVVWVCVLLAGILLPMVLFKKVLGNARTSPRGPGS